MSTIEDGAMQDKDGAQVDDLSKRLRMEMSELAERLRAGDNSWEALADAADAADALESQSVKLARLRERNAELEKERDAAQGTADDIYAKLMTDRARIISLEAELDIANKQIAETGRAWTADRTQLEAAVMGMREALEPFGRYAGYAEDDRSDEDAMECPIGDLRRARAILASSESVVKSEGDNDGDARPLSKGEIMQIWREHGGDQHGPNTETVTMPLSKFFGFIRAIRSLKRLK